MPTSGTSLQLFNRSRFQRVERAEIRSQTSSRRFADFHEYPAHRGNGQTLFLSFFPAHSPRFVPTSAPCDQDRSATCGQCEEIAGVDILLLDQLIDNFVARAVDVQHGRETKCSAVLTLCPRRLNLSGTAVEQPLRLPHATTSELYTGQWVETRFRGTVRRSEITPTFTTCG